MADLQNDPPASPLSAPADAAPSDIISLEEMFAPAGNEPANSNDSILNAAQVFEAQLEQMTAWKHQLAQQMEVLRRDGIRVLERQKALAVERKKLADDRTQVTTDRHYVQKLHRDLESETEQLSLKQTQLELAQAALETTAQQLNQREAELKARENNLQDQENRFLTQDVQLKTSLETLEAQRLQLCDAQRALQQDQETFAQCRAATDSRAGELEALEKSLAEKTADVAAREEQLRIQAQALEAAQANLALQAQQTAAVEESRADLERERETLLAQRQQLQARINTQDQEYAEQLDALAKQSKRLLERRAELDARAAELENQTAAAPSAAPAAISSEQSEQYESQLAGLRTQITQAEQAATEAAARETQLQTELQSASDQLASLRQEIVRTAGNLEAASQIRDDLARQIATQDREHAEESAAQSQLLQSRQKHDEELTALHNQLLLLEQQRNDLMEQVIAAQEALQKNREAATAEQTNLQSQLTQLEEKIITLEAEKSAWQSQQSSQSPLSTQHLALGGESTQGKPPGASRARLIRQARTVRAYRKQLRDSKDSLEKNRIDIAQQREQLRARKENLEQVKRLLEKQEMVMARKLADHNALKTVAAVGIFVIMILGSVFFSVFHFINPLYHAEAIVQLAPPQGMAGAELTAWMSKQAAFVSNNEVTFAAWKILRTPDEHYSMQDVREEWIASLPKNLVVNPDPSTHTLSIQYTGLNPEGVAQVASALATAFATPSSRDSTTQTISYGAGANVLAKATIPQNPLSDNRLMISLSGVAVALFVSLILVILFRHYVARQLREIDDMADEKDLEDIAGDMPVAGNQ